MFGVEDNSRELDVVRAELQAKTEELRAVTQQLWQAAKLATMGELAASIAHELNNPLATVSLRVEGMLAKTAPDDPRRSALEVISHEIERMGNLVANLLQFSRRGEDRSSTLDVAEELLRTLELIRHRFNKSRIRIVQEFAHDAPRIHGNHDQLRQVFLNLLMNALDAMPTAGALTLRITPGALDGAIMAVVVEIVDTGVGIPPENLSRVVEPFFTTKEEGKGTGLGLPICRRIVQEHGGRLELQSEVGNGTTVRITLPDRASAKAQDAFHAEMLRS
jgi:signal transduction histidine kinase